MLFLLFQHLIPNKHIQQTTTINISFPDGGSYQVSVDDSYIQDGRMDVVARFFDRAMRGLCEKRGLDDSRLKIRAKGVSYYEDGQWVKED